MSPKDPLTLVVLAAGAGTRFGRLKQTEPVGPAGESLMEYAAFDARRAGFERTVLIVRREIEEELRARVGSRLQKILPVAYAYQELDGADPLSSGRSKPWGTAHAVLCALPAVPGPFAVINADDYYGRTAYELLAKALRRDLESSVHVLAAYTLEQTLSPHGGVSRGVCAVSSEGNLENVEEAYDIRFREGELSGADEAGELRPLPPSTKVSMNCWGFRDGIREPLEETYVRFREELEADTESRVGREHPLPNAVAALMNEGRATVQVEHCHETWMGMTYAADVEAVRQRLAQLTTAGVYPTPLV